MRYILFVLCATSCLLAPALADPPAAPPAPVPPAKPSVENVAPPAPPCAAQDERLARLEQKLIDVQQKFIDTHDTTEESEVSYNAVLATILCFLIAGLGLVPAFAAFLLRRDIRRDVDQIGKDARRSLEDMGTELKEAREASDAAKKAAAEALEQAKSAKAEMEMAQKAQAASEKSAKEAWVSETMLRAELEYQEKNYAKAIELWGKISSRDDLPPRARAVALVNRGVSYHQMKPPQISKAIHEYRAVLNMSDAPDETHVKALNNLAWGLWERDEDVEGLIEHTRRATQEDPSCQQAWLNLAFGYLLSETNSEAVHIYQRIVPSCNDQALLARTIEDFEKYDDKMPPESADAAGTCVAMLKKRLAELKTDG